LKTYTLEEAKKKLEHYCAYQERSHFQVEKKLREMRMIPEAVDLIILHLINENFLNEERFANAYVRGKFYYKDWGKNKIRQGLKQHFIHQKLIEKSLQQIDIEDYNRTIKKLITKKISDYKTKKAYELKQKITGFLLQKGYAYSEFSNLLNEMI